MKGGRLSRRWQVIGGVAFVFWLCLTIVWRISAVPLLFYLSLWPVLVFIPLYYTYCPQTQRYGVILLLMGILFNKIVVLANGGFMPVVGGTNHGVWVELTDTSRLVFLADILPFKASYGDCLMGVGLVVLLVLPPFFWILEKKRGEK